MQGYSIGRMYPMVFSELAKGTVLQAVFALFRLGLSLKCRQSVAEVHCTDFLPLGGADLCLVPLTVVPPSTLIRPAGTTIMKSVWSW